MDRPATSLIVLALAAGACACELGPDADLEGPRLVAAQLPARRSVDVSVRLDAHFDFSEALDPASLHPGSVALVPWKTVGSCAATGLCNKGSCEAGTCQTDPLTEAALSRLQKGTFEGGLALTLSLEQGPAGQGSRLRVRSPRALSEHVRYSLLIGAVRDRSGAAMIGDDGLFALHRADLVTAHEGSGGPEPRLALPAPDTDEVPTNLAWIDTTFARPVAHEAGGAATLTLRSASGERVVLAEPQPCDGWIPGFCLRWRVPGVLAPREHYELMGGTLRDPKGRQALPHAQRQIFRTAAGPDGVAPALGGVVVARDGHCAVARLEGVGTAHVELEVAGQVARASSPGTRALGVILPLDAAGAIPWTIEATDLADNRAAREGQLHVEQGAIGGLAIVEVLANPEGPEAAGEFIELVARQGGQADDLYISDLDWDTVHARIQAGEGPPGDALGPLAWSVGDVIVLTGPAFDRPIAPGAIHVDLGSTIADGGLKNGGEPLTLYSLGSMQSWSRVHPLSDLGQEQSWVRARPDACDLSDQWIAHPLGRPTPGSIP